MKRRTISLLMSAAIVIALWYGLAIVVSATRGVSFPTPLSTGVSLVGLLTGRILVGHSVYKHFLHSLTRWGVAFSIASVAGVAYGLAAGWRRTLEHVTLPIVHILQLIPGLAWIPVALLMFGIGQGATIFMIAVTAFSPIAINVVGGVRCVDTTYLRAARMMGARGRRILFSVLLPGALPQILSGLRTGLGNGWRVLVAAEMVVGTGTGLGYSIIQARWTLDYASAFSCVLLICLVGLLLERLLFTRIERATVERWGMSNAR